MDNVTSDASNQPPKVEKVVRHRHVTPTAKQIKALQLINEGYSKRKAMIMAGYSVSSAENGPHMVTRSRGAMLILDSMRNSLRSAGLEGEYLAGKFKQWLEAKKDDKDDYRTQLEALKQYRDIMEPKQSREEGLKRKITFEEFVGEPPKNEENKL